MAIGEFILYWRGQVREDQIGIKNQCSELCRVYTNYFRPKLQRRFKTTPRFLCMGKDMPKTNRDVCSVWMDLGDLTLEECKKQVTK